MRIDRRLVALAVVVGLAVVLAWWLWPRSAASRVDATFARIAAAIHGNDASGVIAEIHPDYDFSRMFPKYFGTSEVAAMLGAEDNANQRTLAKRGLAALFYQRGENRLRMTYTVHRVAELADGKVDAEVSLDVGSESGSGQVVDPLSHHHFILARSGWGSPLRILSHDPIETAL